MQDIYHTFDKPLTHGTLIKRYKRFLSDVRLDNGQVITAHVPNSGSMIGLNDPGLHVALSVSSKPRRKLPYTLEMVNVDNTWIGINTQLSNVLVAKAFECGLPEFVSYAGYAREVKYDENSRIDLLLTNPAQQRMYVEVKNVTLKQDNKALFPDAVTIRGTKHLNALIRMREQGHAAALFYLVQRNDCGAFKIADAIDPTYAETFEYAYKKKGVTIICYSCIVTPACIKISKPLKYEP